MKIFVTAGAALLLLAGACSHEDTGSRDLWARTVEPHLSTTRSWQACAPRSLPNHAVAVAQCAEATAVSGRCDDVVNAREEANAMLVSRPQCTDHAIAALETFSRADAAALSDLAGAYYVRAQRKDNPSDLLRAFDAARKAVALNPQPRGAQFNYALILEALSLHEAAMEAWRNAAVRDDGQWADEARAHHAALMRAASQNGERVWPQVQARIDAALDARDTGETRRLIAAFPSMSEKHFEEAVLPAWATAPSPGQLSRVTTFAGALSQFFNDRYFNDVAAAISKTHAIDALREGHLRFAEARGAKDTGITSPAILYDRAARLLRQAGSPQSLLARAEYASQNANRTNDYEAALRQLDSVATEAAPYPSVLARVNVNRLFPAQFANRYDAFFAAYEAAKAAYERIDDWEYRAELATQFIPTMTVVGLDERAWREAFVAIRDASRVPQWKTRYLLTGSTADAALALGHPEAAWLYQNSVLEGARHGPPGHLLSVLDHLARIEVRLGDYDAAKEHLEQARQITIDPKLRVVLQPRLDAAQGELALHTDPSRAVAALTDAIGLAARTEYTTFHALLLARRAEAYQRLGQEAMAAADRREALKLLHAEEERLLRERKRGLEDDFWNSYFSRFQETYDSFIRQLIAQHNVEEAFQYAERARAYEPLDLVRKLPAAPAAFRKLAARAERVDIAQLRAQLPPATFLIEYRVFDDQTFAWIVGRDLFDARPVPARRSDVKRWTKALQDAAGRKDYAAFEAGLQPPYERLLKAPLDVIRRAPGGAAANIVIVPDRELRGLPFAALRDPDTKRYVIEDHAVTISGSALLYVFALLHDRDLPPHDTSALLIGDPAFDPRSTLAEGLSRLPHARWQVEQVRALYPNSEVLLAEQATPRAFLRRAGGAAIVDIAAHGVVNGDAPSQSFLLFNGVLNAQTLMTELHTDKTRLVVLGACSSAGGLPVGAEGIAPLVRPIVGAGVPGVIGALWDIDDATAATLLVSFHRHYRKGSDAAAALREAQLDLLRSSNPGERSGLSWAPFQVIGYASSPFPSMVNITKEKPP